MNTRFILSGVAVALFAAGLMLSTTAEADHPEEAEMTARYRHVVIEGVGEHMKASGMILKGKVHRTDDLKHHAQAIADVATYWTDLFPKGSGPSDVEKTDALDTIWSDWDGFVKANEQWKKASQDFVKAAESGDMDKIKPAFGALGKSCGNCHDTFRKDDD